MFPLFLFLVWILLILLPLLEKKAKGQPGGVSIFPGLPICPLVALGVSALLDLVHNKLGYYIIGSLHIILLVYVICCSIKYLSEIKNKKGEPLA